jgi:hypothetical protein
VITAVPPSTKIALPVIKGAAIAGILFATDIPFVKSLVIALVSAITSGVFLIVATRMQGKRAEQLHDEVRDVKQALGVDKRKADQR